MTLACSSSVCRRRWGHAWFLKAPNDLFTTVNVGFPRPRRAEGKIGLLPTAQAVPFCSAFVSSSRSPAHSRDPLQSLWGWRGNAAPVLPNLLWRPSLWLWLSAGLVCQFLRWLWGLGLQGWPSCSQRKESGDWWHLSLGPDKDVICLVSPQPPGASTQCSGFRRSHPLLWCLWLEETPWYKYLSAEPSHLQPTHVQEHGLGRRSPLP